MPRRVDLQFYFSPPSRKTRDRIEINASVGFTLKKTGEMYTARAVALPFETTGPDVRETERMFREAAGLFLVSCLERGRLEALMEKLGWKLKAVPPARVLRFHEKKTRGKRGSAPEGSTA